MYQYRTTISVFDREILYCKPGLLKLCVINFAGLLSNGFTVERAYLNLGEISGNIFGSRRHNLDESLVRRWARESTKLDFAALESKKSKAF